jgi:hypothetical protein
MNPKFRATSGHLRSFPVVIQNHTQTKPYRPRAIGQEFIGQLLVTWITSRLEKRSLFAMY